MSFFLLFVIPVFQAVVGFLVLRKNFRNPQNWSFALLMFSIAGWVASNSAARFLPEEYTTLMARVSFATAGLLASAFLVFSLTLFDRGVNRLLVYFPLALGVCIAILSLTNVIATEYSRDESGVNHTTFGQGLPFYAGYFITTMLLGITLFAAKYRQSFGIEKYRLRFVLLGLIASTVIGTLSSLLWPWLTGVESLDILGALSTTFFTLGTVFAILKYRFLDVRLIMTKSLVQTVMISTFFGFTIFFVVLLSRVLERSLQMNLVLSAAVFALLMAAAYPTFQRILQSVVQKFFPSQGGSVSFSSSSRDFREIQEKGSVLLCNVLHSTRAELLLFEELEERGWKQEDIDKLGIYFEEHRKALLLDDIPALRRSETADMGRELDRLEKILFTKDAWAVAPLLNHERKLFGFLLLGPKESGKRYTPNDVSYIEAFAGGIGFRIGQILAFENRKTG